MYVKKTYGIYVLEKIKDYENLEDLLKPFGRGNTHTIEQEA